MADDIQNEITRALQEPMNPLAWVHLGQLHLRRGSLNDAESAFRQAVTVGPRHADAWNWLSVAQRGQNRLVEAESSARNAIAIDPAPADHWANLANALALQAKWAQAAAAFRESLSRQPNNAEIWSDLGSIEYLLRRLDAAQAAYERSLAIEPGRLGTLTNWAYLLIDRDAADQALALLQDIVGRDPSRVTAWIAMGNALQKLSRLRQAAIAYSNALQLQPGHSEATHNLEEVQLRLLVAQGMAADAATRMTGTLAARPGIQLHSQLLQTLQYVESIDSSDLLRAHQQWASSYADSLRPIVPADKSPRAAGARLRLGFVSADFGEHPLAFLGLPAFRFLDKTKCFITCYSDRRTDDDFTAQFRANADVWRQTAELSDEELAEQIRQDKIDVLVDLMGHTGKRLLVFARRPAEVQVTWLGYVGTTGLQSIDYLIADRFHVPLGEEERYVETVLRMPNGYVCYGPPHDTPDVGPLPAKSQGQFTFGSFNNPAKYSDTVIAAWAEILHRVPGAKLLLKYPMLDQPELGDVIHARFAQQFIPPNRVILEGRTRLIDHLAAYHRIDLALDTHPYSGGVTTCEALWMGVPVVTFSGKTFASRHSTSHVMNAGYPRFIAADRNSFVELAVSWTNRFDELSAIRSQMREQLRLSPLCDAGRFARDFLALIGQAWNGRVGK